MATIPNLTLDQGMPANVEAEKTILGAILLDNAAHSEAAEKLDSEDFSLDSHRRIFLRMSELMNEQRAVDIVTLSHELARYKEVESVGGVAYLASLTEGLPRRPVIEEYIRIVKDKSLLRKLMGICSMAIARAADQSESALDVLSMAETQLMDFDSLAAVKSGLGSGAIIVMDKSTDVVKAIWRLSKFFKHESCGQCTPCREGTGWMMRMMDRVVQNKASMADLGLLEQVTTQVAGHTICPFGEAASWPIQGMMRAFRPMVEQRTIDYQPPPAIPQAAE